MASTAEEFYDNISNQYTDTVRRCVPRYDEMLSTLFAYLPEHFSPEQVLELGCGTGNLTTMICEKFPDSEITAVDISEECMKECQRRLPLASIQYVKSDFRELGFPAESYDLILSSIAIHHLDDIYKEELFNRIFFWQTPNGILTFCDQFRGETDALYNRHIAKWKAFAFDQGTTEDEWNTWMEHQNQHDHHAPLFKHVNWLTGAGYNTVDCTWRNLLWAVIYAEKK